MNQTRYPDRRPHVRFVTTTSIPKRRVASSNHSWERRGLGYQGMARRVWRRPISAASRAWPPAPMRTPSAMRSATFWGVT